MQEIIEDLIIMKISEGWSKELMFIGIRFRSGLLVEDCETEDMAYWITTIVPELLSWKGIGMSTCAGYNIPGAHMVTVYFPKVTGVEMVKLLRFLITQNTVWKVFTNKEDGRNKLLTIWIDDFSLEAMK